MEKLVIIKPNCHELANHLWNYLSIYAYGLETGTHVYNPSFIEWHRYFNLNTSFVTKIASSLPGLADIWRVLLFIYGSYLIRVRVSCVRLTLGITMFLPPTKPLTGGDVCEMTYFIGWHFRNPAGLKQHRRALIAAFTPKERILKKIEDALAPFQRKRLIGVHLRQQPYNGFPDGDFLIPVSRVRLVIDEYLREKNLNVKDVALVIVSDKNVDPAGFDGLTMHMQCGNDVPSLFLLSRCSVVIGSNSTFCNLSAWFGNVPHIVATNEPVDWEYYENRTTYFENKYATFAQ